MLICTRFINRENSKLHAKHSLPLQCYNSLVNNTGNTNCYWTSTLTHPATHPHTAQRDPAKSKERKWVLGCKLIYIPATTRRPSRESNHALKTINTHYSSRLIEEHICVFLSTDGCAHFVCRPHATSQALLPMTGSIQCAHDSITTAPLFL